MLFHLLHHPLHLLELTQQSSDILQGPTGASSDPAAATGVDDFWSLPLLLGHRLDDTLDHLDFIALDIQFVDTASQSWKMTQQVLQAAHLLDLAQL